MLDKYITCPECEHHISVHRDPALWWEDEDGYFCSYGRRASANFTDGGNECLCTKTKKS